MQPHTLDVHNSSNSIDSRNISNNSREEYISSMEDPNRSGGLPTPPQRPLPPTLHPRLRSSREGLTSSHGCSWAAGPERLAGPKGSSLEPVEVGRVSYSGCSICAKAEYGTSRYTISSNKARVARQDICGHSQGGTPSCFNDHMHSTYPFSSCI